MGNITLRFVPYADIESLDTDSRLGKLLGIVRDRNVVLMEGRLKPEEESMLISRTMNSINKKFKGIELCTIYPEERNMALFKKLRKGFTSMLLGDREGITIIGPATVIKEIRRDPNKIQLFTIDTK